MLDCSQGMAQMRFSSTGLLHSLLKFSSIGRELVPYKMLCPAACGGGTLQTEAGGSAWLHDRWSQGLSGHQ